MNDPITLTLARARKAGFTILIVAILAGWTRRLWEPWANVVLKKLEELLARASEPASSEPAAVTSAPDPAEETSHV